MKSVKIFSSKIFSRILSVSDLHKENTPLIFRRILGIDFKIFTKNLAENSWMLVPFGGRR